MRTTLTQKNLWPLALGDALLEARTGTGMSQQELADRAGVHRTYISDVERGVRNVTVVTILRMCSALNVTPSVFFRLAEKRLNARRLSNQ